MERLPRARQYACIGVAEIVKADALEPRRLLHRCPRALEIDAVSFAVGAGEEISAAPFNPRDKLAGGSGERDAMLGRLLCRRPGLCPNPRLEIEILPLSRQCLAAASSGEEQEADGIRGLLILEGGKRGREAPELVAG